MKLQSLYFFVAAAYLVTLLTSLRKKKGASLGFLLLAFILHAGFLSYRSLFFGFFNLGSILEEPAFLSFALAGIGLCFLAFGRGKEASVVAPMASVFALLYVFLPKGLIPPSAKSPSIFMPIFFFCEILAHAIFISTAAFASLHLIKGEKFEPAHRLAVCGFLVYSIAQVTGATWCYLGWSVPFQWGFRHLHSAVIWCFFANYLHLRFIPWWVSRKKAGYLLAGGLILLAYILALQLGEIKMPRIGG